MFELGLKVFISYLVGSLNGALLIGMLYGIDIRKHGSGNAGGTNALRTQGKVFAALVMAVDIGKGVLPVLLLPGWAVGAELSGPTVSLEWITYACGAAAIFGHCYPVWFEFKGGKGAATTLGVLAAVSPLLVLPAASGWFATLFLFGYVGLATVVAAFAIPGYLLLAESASIDAVVFTAGIAIFVAFTHRSNLSKLLSGRATPDINFRLFKQPSQS